MINLTKDEYKDLLSILNRSYSYSDTHVNNNGDHLFDGDLFNKLEKLRDKLRRVFYG